MRTPERGQRRVLRLLSAIVGTAIIGAFTAMIPATPALAEDNADLRIENRSGALTLTEGGQPQTLTLAITNDGPQKVDTPTVSLKIPLASKGMTVAGASAQCEPAGAPDTVGCRISKIDPGQTAELVMVFNPPAKGSLEPGSTHTESSSAFVGNPAGGDPNPANDRVEFSVTLNAAAVTISEVSGTVVNGTTQQPVPDAEITITDTEGNRGETTTDSSGTFRFIPDSPTALRAGRLKVEATKDGFTAGNTAVDGSKGGKVGDIQLAVTPPVQASPSASPSPSAAPTSAAASAVASPAADEGSSLGGLIAIIIASVIATAILVGGGVWVVLRRNRNKDEDSIASGPPTNPTNTQVWLNGLGAPTGTIPAATPAHTQVMPSAAAAPTQVYGGPTSPAGAPTQVHPPGPYPPTPQGSNETTVLYGSPSSRVYGGTPEPASTTTGTVYGRPQGTVYGGSSDELESTQYHEPFKDDDDDDRPHGRHSG